METEKVNFGSVYEAIRDKLSNPFWTSFVFSWLLVNWKVPFCLFFQDEKTSIIFHGQTKLQFLSEYLNIFSWQAVPLLVLPSLVTWFVADYVNPIISIYFYGRQKEYEDARKVKKHAYDIEDLDRRNELLKKELRNTKIEVAAEKKVKEKEETSDERYREDYDDFKNMSFFKLFRQVDMSSRGSVSIPDVQGINELRNYMYTNDIVENKDGMSVLTQKGKYFMTQRQKEDHARNVTDQAYSKLRKDGYWFDFTQLETSDSNVLDLIGGEKKKTVAYLRANKIYDKDDKLTSLGQELLKKYFDA